MEAYLEDDPTNYLLVTEPPTEPETIKTEPSPSPLSSPHPEDTPHRSPPPVAPRKRVCFDVDDDQQRTAAASDEDQRNASDSDDDARPVIKKSKAFSINDLNDRLLSAQDALFSNDYAAAQQHIDYLVRKCEHRTSLRKRDLHKRNANNSYVHVYFNKRSVTVYNNSYQKPKKINGLVAYKTIKCGNKQNKEGLAIVKSIKKAIAKYTYKCNLTPKNYLSVYDNKLHKCAKLIDEFIQDNSYKVVNENNAWSENINSLPDEKLYPDSSD